MCKTKPDSEDDNAWRDGVPRSRTGAWDPRERGLPLLHLSFSWNPSLCAGPCLWNWHLCTAVAPSQALPGGTKSVKLKPAKRMGFCQRHSSPGALLPAGAAVVTVPSHSSSRIRFGAFPPPAEFLITCPHRPPAPASWQIPAFPAPSSKEPSNSLLSQGQLRGADAGRVSSTTPVFPFCLLCFLNTWLNNGLHNCCSGFCFWTGPCLIHLIFPHPPGSQGQTGSWPKVQHSRQLGSPQRSPPAQSVGPSSVSSTDITGSAFNRDRPVPCEQPC